MAAPPAPIPNVGSQLDRAIAAYLIANGCGGEDDTFPAHSVSTKKYPYTVVKSFKSTHNPETTGIQIYDVQIQCKSSAVNDPKEPNPEFKRVELDKRIGSILALMLQSSDVSNDTLDETARQITAAGRALVTPADDSPEAAMMAENNYDMADFTLTHLYYKGDTRGEPEEDGAAWVEIRHFECRACPANVD